MATWNHALPDFYAALDTWEQDYPYPEDIARNPDNLQISQAIHIAGGWVTVHNATPDQYGQITIVPAPRGRYTRRISLDYLRQHVHHHARLAELRAELERAAS